MKLAKYSRSRIVRRTLQAIAHGERHRSRSFRVRVALAAARVERRLGREMTDQEWRSFEAVQEQHDRIGARPIWCRMASLKLTICRLGSRRWLDHLPEDVRFPAVLTA